MDNVRHRITCPIEGFKVKGNVRTRLESLVGMIMITCVALFIGFTLLEYFLTAHPFNWISCGFLYTALASSLIWTYLLSRRRDKAMQEFRRLQTRNQKS